MPSRLTAVPDPAAPPAAPPVPVRQPAPALDAAALARFGPRLADYSIAPAPSPFGPLAEALSEDYLRGADRVFGEGGMIESAGASIAEDAPGLSRRAKGVPYIGGTLSGIVDTGAEVSGEVIHQAQEDNQYIDALSHGVSGWAHREADSLQDAPTLGPIVRSGANFVDGALEYGSPLAKVVTDGLDVLGGVGDFAHKGAEAFSRKGGLIDRAASGFDGAAHGLAEKAGRIPGVGGWLGPSLDWGADALANGAGTLTKAAITSADGAVGTVTHPMAVIAGREQILEHIPTSKMGVPNPFQALHAKLDVLAGQKTEEEAEDGMLPYQSEKADGEYLDEVADSAIKPCEDMKKQGETLEGDLCYLNGGRKILLGPGKKGDGKSHPQPKPDHPAAVRHEPGGSEEKGSAGPGKSHPAVNAGGHPPSVDGAPGLSPTPQLPAPTERAKRLARDRHTAQKRARDRKNRAEHKKQSLHPAPAGVGGAAHQTPLATDATASLPERLVRHFVEENSHLNGPKEIGEKAMEKVDDAAADVADHKAEDAEMENQEGRPPQEGGGMERTPASVQQDDPRGTAREPDSVP